MSAIGMQKRKVNKKGILAFGILTFTLLSGKSFSANAFKGFADINARSSVVTGVC